MTFLTLPSVKVLLDRPLDDPYSIWDIYKHKGPPRLEFPKTWDMTQRIKQINLQIGKPIPDNWMLTGDIPTGSTDINLPRETVVKPRPPILEKVVIQPPMIRPPVIARPPVRIKPPQCYC